MQPKQLVTLGFLSLALSLRAAPIRDYGVDPANLGKGDWLSYLQYATNNFRDPKLPGIAPVKSVVDVPTLFAYEKSLGMDYVIVKAGSGSTNYMLGRKPQFTTNLVRQAHAAGLKIFGYTRSYGQDIQGEINLATYVYNCGADGFVIDAEAEWERSRSWIGTNGVKLATELCKGIRARHPNWFLAHSPMPVISYHASFPYKVFGLYCDAVMPQLYWTSFGKTPEETVDWMDQEWNRWHKSLSGIYTNAIKPIVPVGPGGPGMSGREVVDFVNYLKSDPKCLTSTGYRGVNFFRAGRYTPDVQRVFREISFDEPVSTLKRFFKVKASDVTATSAQITWRTQKYAGSTVEFGTTTNYGSTISDSIAKFSHAVVLTNITPNTVYHFRLRLTNSLNQVRVSPDFLLLTARKKVAADVAIEKVSGVPHP